MRTKKINKIQLKKNKYDLKTTDLGSIPCGDIIVLK